MLMNEMVKYKKYSLFMCECGFITRYGILKKHIYTKKHIDKMKNITGSDKVSDIVTCKLIKY
jgi:hypothetical protein